MRKIKKNITMGSLALSIEDLAVMVGKGFNDVQKQLNNTHSDINDMKEDIVSMKEEIGELNDGQEQIKLRLDNVAYRFELVDVQRRVTHLEKKAGIRYK